MEPAESPTPRVPAEPIRQIDWLGLAPWLILLRVPQACLVAPLVIGGIGAVLLGWPSSDARSIVFDLNGVVDTVVRVATFDPNGTGGSLWSRVGLMVWPFVGVLIPRLAASSLLGSGRERLWDSLRFAPKRCLRVMIAIWLLMTPIAGIAVLGGAYRLALSWSVTELVAAAFLPLAIWLLAIPAVLLLGAVALGIPLVVAAVCLDDADAFDAASRALAYSTQRLGRLLFYVAVAAAVGLAAGVFVEVILEASIRLIGSLGSEWPISPASSATLSWGAEVAIRGVRGFYPAYFFTAATAIYLLLRRDVDGQPIDVIAGDQPAA